MAPISGAMSMPRAKPAWLAASNRPSILSDRSKKKLPPLRIAWGKTVDTIVNNGHTIQLNAGQGNVLNFGSGPYRLLQFHFHHPSEHLFNGKRFAMEAHFVHAHASGALAVVATLMVAGKHNPVFSKIITTMPTNKGETVKADTAINRTDSAARATRLLSLSWLVDDTALLRNRQMVAAY